MLLPCGLAMLWLLKELHGHQAASGQSQRHAARSHPGRRPIGGHASWLNLVQTSPLETGLAQATINLRLPKGPSRRLGRCTPVLLPAHSRLGISRAGCPLIGSLLYSPYVLPQALKCKGRRLIPARRSSRSLKRRLQDEGFRCLYSRSGVLRPRHHMTPLIVKFMFYSLTQQPAHVKIKTGTKRSLENEPLLKVARRPERRCELGVSTKR